MKEHTFYCEPLRADIKNQKLIQNFSITREEEYRNADAIIGLASYLRCAAWSDDETDRIRAYLIKDKATNEIVAYFALKAGSVPVEADGVLESDVNNEELLIPSGIKLVNELASGIEISHFAINDTWRQKHQNVKYLGLLLFPQFIVPIILQTAKLIGVQIVYLFAADKQLVPYYRDYFGFIEMDAEDIFMPLKPMYDKGCIFMYRPIYDFR